MKVKNLTYTSLILVHIVIGFLIYIFAKFAVVYGIAILSIGLLLLLKTQNDKNQVLYICGYVIGSEVLLRMTNGFLLYEIAKYSLVFFTLLSIYFSGFSKNSFPYWVFLIVLIPGIIVASYTLNLDSNIKKTIAFNILGPISLGVSAMYCYQRKITLKELDNVLFAIFLPIVSTVTYMFFYTPSIKEIITDTNSNFETSGGFGPNQVSTVLGLGVFVIFTRLLFHTKERLILIINFSLLAMITFRGIVTFSRGGMICSLVMIIVLMMVLFRVTKNTAKIKLIWVIILSLVSFMFIWFYSSNQTSGLIDKRYANQDAAGRLKESRLSGREAIIESEINLFLDHPFLGVGVGKGKEYRYEITKDAIASHNEVTRMLAEHGAFGILALLILIITPFALYINNRQHIYMLSFFTFWILTINHAAMRLAAPAFVYALSLVHVYGAKVPKNIRQDNELIEN